MNKLRKVFTILFCLCILVCFKSHAGAELKLKKILVIDSFHKGYHWTDLLCKGITSEIKTQLKNVEIHYECMDSKRYVSKNYVNALKNIYAIKYKEMKPDIIIANAADAFNFMLKYGKEIFGNTPFVFSGVYEISPRLARTRKNFTGAIQAINFYKTINIILKLHKKLKTLYIIVEATKSGDSIRELITKNLKNKNINYKFLSGRELNLRELTNILSKIDKKDAVFHTVWLKDKSNENYNYRKSAKIIASASAAPVYTFAYPFVDTGIVGGAIFSPEEHGKTVAKMAVRVLNGEAPSSIPIIRDDETKNIFDYNALKKWNIDVLKYFKNSTVLNAPRSFYNKHGKMLLILLSILLAISFFSIMILLNIFKRRKAEETTKKHKMVFDKVVEFTPYPILITSDANQTVYINRNFKETFGYTLDEVGTSEKWFIKAFPNKGYREHAISKWKKILSRIDNTDFVQDEFEIATKDGTFKSISLWIKKIDPIGFFLVLEDITAEKEYELATKELITSLEDAYNQKDEAYKETEQSRHLLELNNKKLEKAYEKAEESNRIKSEFLAIMSHEIRTPLTSMIGYSQLLLINSGLDEKKLKYIRIIYESGTRLLNLLTDLLELSVLESKGIQAEYETFDIRKVVEDVYALLLPGFEEKKLSFEQNLNSIKYIHSDQLKIRQIIFNLVGNALKFTENGKISLFIEKKEKSYLITVKDTGIGISKENYDVIFELFRQAEDAHKRKYGGTGLGLAICKKLANAINSRIWVESKEGKGSSFYVEIPLLEQADTLPPEELSEGHDAFEVMLYDEENKLLVLLQKLFDIGSNLKSRGFNDLNKALYELKKSSSYKLIITCLLSPEIKPKELFNKIKELNKDAIIVAISEDERCKEIEEIGFDECYVWPISSTELMDLIENTKSLV